MADLDREDVNRPDVVAELTAMYDRYETALMADDRSVLDLLFWNSPTTIRYAMTNQNGHDAIKADRKATSRGGGAIKREVRRMTVTTYFRPSSRRHGRQSQVWVKFAEGWRVVSAHVSLLPE